MGMGHYGGDYARIMWIAMLVKLFDDIYGADDDDSDNQGSVEKG